MNNFEFYKLGLDAVDIFESREDSDVEDHYLNEQER